jgi:hypothetical protein
MQCDRCGKKIDTNDPLTCEAVGASMLCRVCYELLTADSGLESSSNVKQTSPTQKILTGCAVAILLLVYLWYVGFTIKTIILQLIFYGPSILAVLVAHISSFETKLTTFKVILILVSVILHATSSFFVFYGFGIGEAWSGYGLPALYAFGGALLILVIALLPKSMAKKPHKTACVVK